MSHSTSQAKLGNSGSSAKDITTHNVDPASFLAGLKVYMGSDGLPTLTKGSNFPMGISMGRSLSDHKKLAVLRTGQRVPVRAHLKRSTGLITISSYANLVSGTDDSVTVGATVFTAQAGAATPGDTTFQAATSNSATATSLAAQINAHATASTLVYAVASSGTVRLYSIVEGAGSGNDVAVAYTDNDTNVGITLSELTGGKLAGGSDTITDIDYIAVGAKAYFNNTTGKVDVAMTGFSTVSDAVFVGTELTGLDEDDASVAAVIVDMVGGL